MDFRDAYGLWRRARASGVLALLAWGAVFAVAGTASAQGRGGAFVMDADGTLSAAAARAPAAIRSVVRGYAERDSFECTLVGGWQSADVRSVGEYLDTISELLELGRHADLVHARGMLHRHITRAPRAWMSRGPLLMETVSEAASLDPSSEGFEDALDRAGIAARELIESLPSDVLARHCNAIYESVDVAACGGCTIVNVDARDAVVVASGFHLAGAAYVWVRNIDPSSTVDIVSGGHGGMPLGEAALRIAASALGHGQFDHGGGEDERPMHGESGYASRVFPVDLVDDQRLLARVAEEGGTDATEVAPLPMFSVVCGVALAAGLLLQPTAELSPFGAVSAEPARDPMTGEILPDDPATYRWDADSVIPALSVNAFIGFRMRDVMLAAGVLLTSTTGAPLQGVSIHFGGRARNLSQGVYFGGFGGFQWDTRPVIGADGLVTSVDVDTFPRTGIQLAGIVGLELMFDLVSLLSSREGVVGALLGN
ncbi:MAG: hypothetical protein U0234_12485 [Sandaracinus sp.]